MILNDQVVKDPNKIQYDIKTHIKGNNTSYDNNLKLLKPREFK